jgi:DNA-binding NtrC family response regulator
MGKILIVDTDEQYCDHITQFFDGLDHAVSRASSCTGAVELLDAQSFDVVICDIDIPGTDIRSFIRKIKTILPSCSLIIVYPETCKIQEELGDTSKLIFRSLQKPFYDAELHFQVKRALEDMRHRGAVPAETEESVNLYSEFIGQSPAIGKIFRVIARVAKIDVSVIILGETGTGKELVARTLHRDSLRSAGPFVSVNCAALPEQLLESELFGYEKGSFTGADRMRVGRFEHANGGTIFLDEVADMSLVTQAKLLRVIQQKEFERLGSNVTIKTDVRILSATNKDLPDMMRKGLFREDLFYRLNVIALRLPPLRERAGDISLLLLYFLKRSNIKMRKNIRGFSAEALEILTNYRWPGNIREMENTLDRAVLMTDGDLISPDDLDLLFDGTDFEGDFDGVRLPARGITLEEAENQLIAQALARCGGSQKKAAELLGISGRVLNYKIMNLRRGQREGL